MKWIKNLKTGELYRNKWEASRKLGITAEHARRLAVGRRKSSAYRLAIFDDGEPEEELPRERNYPRSGEETLCGECDNYFCSWMARLEPVKGWEAERVPEFDSYLVRKCPLFRENPRRR